MKLGSTTEDCPAQAEQCERSATRQPQLNAVDVSILKHFARLFDALRRSIAVPLWLKDSRPAGLRTERNRTQVSALRDRLHIANEQVAQSRWLATEWRTLTQRKNAAGLEESEFSELLCHFE